MYDIKGKIYAICGISTDITEQKQTEQKISESEERFRALFEGAPDAIFLINQKTGKIIDANPAASRLLLKPYQEIIGLNQSQLHPALLDKISQEKFIRYGKLTQGNQITLLEYVVIRSDGVEVPVEIMASTIYIRGKPILREMLGVIEMDTVEKFANQIMELSHTHNSKYLTNYANKLFEFSQSFDIVNTEKTLAEFSDILKKFKQYATY